MITEMCYSVQVKA